MSIGMKTMILAQYAVVAAMASVLLTDLDPAKFIACCVVGSIMGSFASLTLFPVPDDVSQREQLQRLSAKFFVSLSLGVFASPALSHLIWRHYCPEMPALYVGLAVSGIVALLGVSIVHLWVVPLLHMVKPRAVLGWVLGFFGFKLPQESQPNDQESK